MKNLSKYLVFPFIIFSGMPMLAMNPEETKFNFPPLWYTTKPRCFFENDDIDVIQETINETRKIVYTSTLVITELEARKRAIPYLARYMNTLRKMPSTWPTNNTELNTIFNEIRKGNIHVIAPLFRWTYYGHYVKSELDSLKQKLDNNKWKDLENKWRVLEQAIFEINNASKAKL